MTEIGDNAIRAEVVDRTVKGIAERAYKFKQAVSIVPTSAWKNTFWRESSTPLTAKGTNIASIEGIPRGAAFPQLTPSWTEHPTHIEKFGGQNVIHWEDILSDEIDVQARVMFKVTEGVTKTVDDEIWNILTESRIATGTYAINEVTITDTEHWSGTSAAIIDDVMYAKQLIGEDNYATTGLMMFISPKDHRSIMRWLSDKGAQFPTVGEEMARNGRVGTIAGVQLVVSNSVTASYALIVVPKICATWKELVPFQSTSIVDPYRSVTIRVVEEGTCQLTDPNAVCIIRNTQGVGAE